MNPHKSAHPPGTPPGHHNGAGPSVMGFYSPAPDTMSSPEPETDASNRVRLFPVRWVVQSSSFAHATHSLASPAHSPSSSSSYSNLFSQAFFRLCRNKKIDLTAFMKLRRAKRLFHASHLKRDSLSLVSRSSSTASSSKYTNLDDLVYGRASSDRTNTTCL